MGNLGEIRFPEDVKRLTIVADNDAKDWRAGRRLMRKAAYAQASRGLTVSTLWPPRGMDLNDLLMKDRAA